MPSKQVLTFYPMPHYTEDLLKQACKKSIGEPVWDHPTKKNKQIGKIIKAVPDMKDGVKQMKLIMEIFDDATILKINQSSLKGIRIGGSPK